MKTPLNDFVSSYIVTNPVRFHMPGHKGSGIFHHWYFESLVDGADITRFDITEVKGTEDLIPQSEANASVVFGCPTYYSAEGSSLCIRAMLSLLYRKTHRKTVVAARNCHQTFISACALLDLDVIWLPDDEGLLSSSVDLNVLDKILNDASPCCVYITSPDYLGAISDIASIASVCHKHDCYLAVDNAHGAYLKFFNMHPMDLGADICCDSAHKTLPVLTGGAYLHVSNELNSMDVRRELTLYASTSPSWLILASLDRCNKFMSDPRFNDSLRKLAEKVASVSSSTKIEHYGNEPLKLTLCPNSFGYSGDELATIFRSFNIEPEFSDINYVTLMFSINTTMEDIEALQRALDSIEPMEPLEIPGQIVPDPQKVLSIREAVYGATEVISVDEAEGRVAGFVKTSCPPAVPIVIAGERITAEHIEVLKEYGFETIEVCCDIE